MGKWESAAVAILAALLAFVFVYGLLSPTYQQPYPYQPPTTPTPTPTPPQPTPTTPPITTPPITTPPQQGTVVYSYTIFESEDGSIKGRQIWVPVGTNVKVYVTVRAYGGDVSGWLRVEVRKDIQYWFDEHYIDLYQFISLKDGEEKTIYVGTFKTVDITGVNNFREYFVKVYFGGNCIYDPTDPNTREWVKTYTSQTPPTPPPTTPIPPITTPPQQGNIVYQYTEFTSSSGEVGRQIWVPVGDDVHVYVVVKAEGGYVNGQLHVEVRKDIQYWFDEKYVDLYKQISLNGGEVKKIYMGSFKAVDVTGENLFREYFVKVYFNGVCIYDPTNPDTREWVKTYKDGEDNLPPVLPSLPPR